MKKTIKKYVAGAFMVALFGIYAGYQSIQSAGTALQNTVASATISPETNGTLSTATASAAKKTPYAGASVNVPEAASPQAVPVVVAPAAPQKTQGSYTDGIYIGNSVNAYYGNVQVQVTVKAGKITNVVAMETPSGRRESQAINSRAVPELRSEVISVQSSKVNAVSGATYTSLAYKQSVASALTQAV